MGLNKAVKSQSVSGNPDGTDPSYLCRYQHLNSLKAGFDSPVCTAFVIDRTQEPPYSVLFLLMCMQT